MNIYEKLLKAREEFAKAKVKKSGVNRHAEFEYYELEDIVPVSEKIMRDVKAIFVTSFADGYGIGRFVDIEKGEHIEFTIPIIQIAEPSKFRMNEVQATGAMVTYYRRYLYMLLFDIVERDELDNDNTPKELPKVEKKPEPKKPVTAEQRQDIKENLTSGNAKADEVLLDGLKNVCKQLLQTDPSQEEFVQSVALKTNNFTDIEKDKCRLLIDRIIELLNTYEQVLPIK